MGKRACALIRSYYFFEQLRNYLFCLCLPDKGKGKARTETEHVSWQFHEIQ